MVAPFKIAMVRLQRSDVVVRKHIVHLIICIREYLVLMTVQLLATMIHTYAGLPGEPIGA